MFNNWSVDVPSVFQLFRKVYKNKNELLYKNKNELLYNGPQSKLTRLSSFMKSKTQDVYRYELRDCQSQQLSDFSSASDFKNPFCKQCGL